LLPFNFANLYASSKSILSCQTHIFTLLLNTSLEWMLLPWKTTGIKFLYSVYRTMMLILYIVNENYTEQNCPAPPLRKACMENWWRVWW